MKSSVVAVAALPKLLLLANRDNDLNEKAFQRALLARDKSQSPQDNPPLYSVLVFQPSDGISLQQMAKETTWRQRVVEMQNQLNDNRSHKAELMMH